MNLGGEWVMRYMARWSRADLGSDSILRAAAVLRQSSLCRH